MHYVDGLAQDCSDSSAIAMELLQSCTKPSMSSCARWFVKWSEGSDEKLIFSGIMGINMKNIARP